MKGLNCSGYAVGICAAAAMLAGCGGALSPTALGVTPQGRAIPDQADRGASWMLPEAKSEDLLYVSNGVSGVVYIFAYPSGKPVGKLSNLNGPEGLCVDGSGDVFVVAQGSSRIYEYPHGSTDRVRQLKDPYGSPTGCAVNKNTGDLAVANSYNYYNPSNVTVYPGRRGKPSVFQDQGMSTLSFCGYDDRDNLFADGYGQSFNVALVELPKGGRTLRNISLDQTLPSPGAVQWDGQRLAVGDTETPSSGYATIYRFAISGKEGRESGSAILDADRYVAQSWIEAGVIIAGNLDDGTVMFWKYPAGGASTGQLDMSFQDPVGIVVSEAASVGANRNASRDRRRAAQL